MKIIETLINVIGVVFFMGGVIYLFKLFNQKKPADVIPFNNSEREAIKKAQLDLELGIKEARQKFEARKLEYMKTRQKLFKPQLVRPESEQGDKRND